MTTLNIRKICTFVEETFTEAEQPVNPPLRKVAIAAVIKNPHAGRYSASLDDLIDFGEELGGKLTDLAAKELGCDVSGIKGFGKAAIVGTSGELEHCAAVIHPKMGKPFRARIGGGVAIIPSTKKRGGPGTRVDIPFFLKDNQWSMPYLDAMEVNVPDAPAPDEIVVVVALTNGPRPLSRLGGDGETEEQRRKRAGGA